MVLTAWSYKDEYPTDYAEIKRIGDIFASKVKEVGNVNYKVGPPPRIIYAVSGGSIDYVYAKLGVKYSYALELRDDGRYGFTLPARFIKPSGVETTAAFMAAFEAMCGPYTGKTCKDLPKPTKPPCSDKAS
jgi:hypothetical protein